MKLLQINTTVNSGSTGRIAEEIGLLAMQAGHQSFIAAANTTRPSSSGVIQIGTSWDRKLHGLKTRLLDRHGFGSGKATKELVSTIEQLNPDLIHLHNIHGYYLHIELLFNYLKEVQKPVVWTFHDCWPFTGHCSYFDAVNCFKWQTECYKCPNKKGYPASYGLDKSKRNFHDKKRIFNSVQHAQIVTPSKWLANHVQKSFLQYYPVQVIPNGINLNQFKPYLESDEIKKKWNLVGKKIILGVASIWDKRKGLEDFIQLSHRIKSGQHIVLVGMEQKIIKSLPFNITGIERTESIVELAELYASADVFVNPTYVDNFPTTNIEALACGTPVITYNTGGSPEAIDENTGIVVEKGNIETLAKAITQVIDKGKEHYSNHCRVRAEKYFNKDDRYRDYLKIYESLIQ
jgi:putative colanic acid biosynthesis glycosyltransferase